MDTILCVLAQSQSDDVASVPNINFSLILFHWGMLTGKQVTQIYLLYRRWFHILLS